MSRLKNILSLVESHRSKFQRSTCSSPKYIWGLNRVIETLMKLAFAENILNSEEFQPLTIVVFMTMAAQLGQRLVSQLTLGN